MLTHEEAGDLARAMARLLLGADDGALSEAEKDRLSLVASGDTRGAAALRIVQQIALAHGGQDGDL